MDEDILCEIAVLKERLAEVRSKPPHCYCSAVLYWSKVVALENEIREWEQLAQEEGDADPSVVTNILS